MATELRFSNSEDHATREVEVKGSLTGTFWAVLAYVNILALLYPISTLSGADTEAARFLSAIAIMTVVFILGVMDVVAVTIAFCRNDMGSF